MAMGMLQEQGGRPAAQCQRTWVALAAALVCASVGAQEGATTAINQDQRVITGHPTDTDVQATCFAGTAQHINPFNTLQGFG